MVDVAVNECSFVGHSSLSDVDLLRGLGHTMMAVRRLVPVHGRGSIGFAPPDLLGGAAARLPGGGTLGGVLDALAKRDPDLRTLLLSLLDYPGIPCCSRRSRSA